MDCWRNLWSACGFHLISNSITCKTFLRCSFMKGWLKSNCCVLWLSSVAAACSVCMSNLGYNTKILPKAQIACFAYRIDVFILYCINKFSQSLVELLSGRYSLHLYTFSMVQQTQRRTWESRELKVGGEKWLCNIYLFFFSRHSALCC